MKQARTEIIKHLEMIQDVITRFSHNACLVKGWSLTLLSAVLVFIVRNEASAYFTLILLIPTFTFWGLDAYFLRYERLYRYLYDEVRASTSTDFTMSVDKYRDNEEIRDVLLSHTLKKFYGMEISFVLVMFSVLLFTSTPNAVANFITDLMKPCIQ